MLSALQMEKAELSIVLTGDKQIHKLNKIYRGKDRATDVLAFAMKEGEFGAVSAGLLGDVIVSIPTAARQARERNVAPLDEVTMLIAHGILHLLGWDHDTDRKDRAMRKETDRLCAAAVRAPLYKGRKPRRQT
jgi:probable rRNA maturation factor